MIQTSRRLAAERQIHAAIAHFRAGDFECAITLCSAAENQMPKPSEPTHLHGILQRYSAEHPPPDGQKDDFNCIANWMKHGTMKLGTGAVVEIDEVEIEEWVVKLWLNRAISKYRAVYGIGTPEMAALFPWAGQARALD